VPAASSQPAIEGWFSTDEAGLPHLVGAKCPQCGTYVFPPRENNCPSPACDGDVLESVALSRRGTIWSYTDAQYQPPPPYVPTTDPFEPFALAAVELPEGLVVLGQVAQGYGVADLRVGAEAELVVENLDAEHSIWRWKPVTEMGEEADQ